MNKYEEYISRLSNVKNKCSEITLEMQEEFPELIRVRGYYLDPLMAKHPHWWLKTSEGEIIDPTEKQFFIGGHYEELDESLPEPTSKCPNCGEYCYNNRSLCSKQCSVEYMEYLKTGML